VRTLLVNYLESCGFLRLVRFLEGGSGLELDQAGKETLSCLGGGLY
jgi:hypothetical protein